MPAFIIEGSHRLHGEIEPQGAKNEILQILCAILLTQDEVTVSNVPDIVDVRNLIDMLVRLGVQAVNPEPGVWKFKAEKINTAYALSLDFVAASAGLRGSVMLLGPLLARLGRAVVSQPGGDKIGRRRVDTHIRGFQALGADFVQNEEHGFYELKAEKLKGCYMLLDEASVTGTANILMAAVLAEGDTVIYNAACEPYVQQLCRMLVSMGARIDGIGSNLLTVHGVTSLHGAQHRALPDMIEVGSFIGMAAMTASEITIKNVSYPNLGIIPSAFSRLGIQMEQRGDDIYIPAQEHYSMSLS